MYRGAKYPKAEVLAKAESLHGEVTSDIPDKASHKVLEAANDLAQRGPIGAHACRNNHMAHLRAQAKLYISRDKLVADSIDVNVRAVLDKAGPTGSHLAFFRQALCEVGYGQTQEVCDDLQHGFPLYGLIPVERSSKPRLIRRASRTPADLKNNAKAMWDSCLAKCSRSLGTTDEYMRAEIFRQTVEEQYTTHNK